MTVRLRFLLDTNILIPLQDSMVVLEPHLANFVRLAGVGGHQLLSHPASLADIQRDRDVARRSRTLARLQQYTSLQAGPACPWNTAATNDNDRCDNDILYALERSAAHALVTEDQGLHAKAKTRGLQDRVFFIQTAEDWLKRLHAPTQVQLPRIQDVELHTLTNQLADPFFDSIRQGYPGFDDWFQKKAREGRSGWIYRSVDTGSLEALCIYAVQNDQQITDDGTVLPDAALKLCTFKVGELVRGRKIGELFLRAAFQRATDQRCEAIFLHADPVQHVHLVELLEDFGFRGVGSFKGDHVYVKQHPVDPPPSPYHGTPLEYVTCFYPHFQQGPDIGKFAIPIQPRYHQILFPDYAQPGAALPETHPRTHVGNAMKLAYLCHARTDQPRPGDLVLFYRTADMKAVTSLGVVERFEVPSSATEIAAMVRRRTVYSDQEIDVLARKPTKVILFRLIRHLSNAVSMNVLDGYGVPSPIQSIRKITDVAFSSILRAGG